MEKARELRELLTRRVVFLDGATGTELMRRGLPAGASPELWASERPEVISQIYRDYVDAGSDVVLANTFGANRAKLGNPGLVQKVNELMARTAIQTVGDRAFVGASVGPTGLLMYPEGPLRMVKAYEIFREHAEALVKAGIEIFFLETFMDMRELKAAALAVRDVCPEGFISMQMTFDQGGISLTGTGPAGLALLADHLAVDAVGVNCGLGPEAMLPVIQEAARYTSRFIVAEPNAGLPVAGRYSMGPEEFAGWAEDIAWAGANIIGGCCGTTPDHVREFVRLVGQRPPQKKEGKNIRAITSLDRVLVMGRGTVAVGESVNPTGRPGLQKAITEGDADAIVSVARFQADADAIDINLGLEKLIPAGLVSEIFARLCSGPPVLVDLSSPEFIGEAFQHLAGIGVLNSLTAREEDISAKVGTLLRHGGYAVLLPIDEDGLGETVQERIAKIKRGLDALREHGFPAERVIADPVVKPVAAGGSADITLKTLESLKSMGLLSVAGVSNVSHGLPGREGMNAAMVSALAERGLDLAIIDVGSRVVIEALRGARAVFQGLEPEETVAENEESPRDPVCELAAGVISGDKALVRKKSRALLQAGHEAAQLIEKCLVPAMARVGELYEQRRLFLPQLVRAAEAADALLEILRPRLQEGEARIKGTVVIATVRGDVHDIGKNLVALFLRNAGFRVIDLGKDVPAEKIVQVASDEKAEIIALSALMSTTAPRMEEVIRLVREKELTVKVMIGGAVITGDFARAIGADGYGRDAYEAIRVAEGLVRARGNS